MCTVSMIMDDWNKRHNIPNNTDPIFPYIIDNTGIAKEIEDLKKEVESLKKLLKAAKIYDEETGQPDCEIDEKVEAFKKLAKILDINVEDVFEK